MSLTKPAISALAIETSCLDLWNEFLGLYFTGTAHVVGGNPSTTFLKAEFLFGQALPPHPAESGVKATPLSIHLVMATPGKVFKAFEPVPGTGAREEWATSRPVFLIYVRCGVSDTVLGNADRQCRMCAEQLHGLLNNSFATKPLAEKGIHRLKATTPAVVSGGSALDYSARMFSATAQLRWRLFSQT